MEFQHVIDEYKAALRGEIPPDAWQYDVTERLRGAIAKDLRLKLRGALGEQDADSGSPLLQRVHGRMREDLVGKYGMAGPDRVDAEVVSLLGTADALSRDDAYGQVLADSVDFTAYKFARWQNMTKLEDLTALCTEFSDDARERGIDGLKRLTSFTLHMLCLMECDADAKRNFRNDPTLARTRGHLKGLFMDQWSLLNGAEEDDA